MGFYGRLWEPFGTPRSPQKGHQDTLKGPARVAKESYGLPKRFPRNPRPKFSQGIPRDPPACPRGPQVVPKGSQGSSRSPQGSPTSPQGDPEEEDSFARDPWIPRYPRCPQLPHPKGSMERQLRSSVAAPACMCEQKKKHLGNYQFSVQRVPNYCETLLLPLHYSYYIGDLELASALAA